VQYGRERLKWRKVELGCLEKEAVRAANMAGVTGACRGGTMPTTHQLYSVSISDSKESASGPCPEYRFAAARRSSGGNALGLYGRFILRQQLRGRLPKWPIRCALAFPVGCFVSADRFCKLGRLVNYAEEFSAIASGMAHPAWGPQTVSGYMGLGVIA
jgi:hypothetical protein